MALPEEILSLQGTLLEVYPKLVFIIIISMIWTVLAWFIDAYWEHISKQLHRHMHLRISKFSTKAIIYTFLFLLILVNIPGVDQQILQLLGLILTGILAFSSSTLIGNGMSGILIRIMHPFKEGQIIKSGEFFGEVSEIRIFHTTIETPKKEIIYIPNGELMKGPVVNYSRDTPMLSVDIGLGYDMDRITAEELILTAANKVGLKKCFVAITKLGDYGINYRVNGILEDFHEMPFIESLLRKTIIDEFHLAQEEIITPLAVSQRPLRKTIPKKKRNSKKRIVTKQKKEKEFVQQITKEAYREAEEHIRKMREQML